MTVIDVTPKKLKFSKLEIREMFNSWTFISFIFALFLTRNIFSANFLFALVISAFTVGIGFVLHEIAHKVVAVKYRCDAEYYADRRGYLFSIVLAFLGFIFIRPGAVRISGHLTKKQYGLISVAGPVVNLILGIMFFASSWYVSELASMIFLYAAQINTWLGIFNMLPFLNFDGRKVYRWNKVVYFIVIGFMVVVNYLIGYFS